MNLLKPLFAAVLLFAFSNTAVAQIGAAPKKDASLQDATDTEFKPGDVWEYSTRPGEKQSTITILKVDASPELGIIVHVGVERIKLANCHGAPSPEAVPHMPFARKALEDSVTKKVASNQPLPDFRDGYEEWKEAYSKKKAGIYVVGVSSAVGVAEKTYRSGIGCQSDSPIAQVRDVLNGDFEIVTSVDSLPTQVKSAFAALARQSSFEMADPGREFRATDVVSKEGLPSRRLIFAGTSAGKWFLHYERGGYAHSYYVVVFTIDGSKAKFVWGTTLLKPAASLADLQVNVLAAPHPSVHNLTF